MLGTSETMRLGGRASSTATPDASTRATIRRSAGRGSRVHVEGRGVSPVRLALGLEVARVHEMQAVVQVHLELASAVAAADPARRVLEERVELARRQAEQPFEADGSGPGLLHTDGRGELGPHARELFEDLSAAGACDAPIDQLALQVRLDEDPAPRGNPPGAPLI